MPNYKTLHKHFKFNGRSYSKEELRNLGNSYIKNGVAYERAIGEFFLDWLNESETIKVTTSGSTGKPKAMVLKKLQMLNSAMATGNFFQLKSADKALLCLSANYIAGKMMLVRAMVLGLEIDCVSPTSKPLINNTKHYDFCAMVPLQVENSLSELKYISTLLVGGAAISNILKHKIQHLSCQVYETYGMTETITHIAIKKANNVGSMQAIKTSFKALPNVNFSIDNRNCLVIDAPKISDELVITNDVIKLISKTEFEWLGRFDSIINSGGVKLIPEQIESKFSKVISNRFFVAGLPDEKLGQKMVLIVEGEVDNELLSRKIETLSSVEKYEKPKAVYVLPAFLETETGKIQRKNTLKLLFFKG